MKQSPNIHLIAKYVWVIETCFCRLEIHEILVLSDKHSLFDHIRKRSVI